MAEYADSQNGTGRAGKNAGRRFKNSPQDAAVSAGRAGKTPGRRK